MFSSQNARKDLLFSIYIESRTVFRLNKIAMLIGETNFVSLNGRLNFYVLKGNYLNHKITLENIRICLLF
jgi:hypothetical protein